MTERLERFTRLLIFKSSFWPFSSFCGSEISSACFDACLAFLLLSGGDGACSFGARFLYARFLEADFFGVGPGVKSLSSETEFSNYESYSSSL